MNIRARALVHSSTVRADYNFYDLWTTLRARYGALQLFLEYSKLLHLQHFYTPLLLLFMTPPLEWEDQIKLDLHLLKEGRPKGKTWKKERKKERKT